MNALSRVVHIGSREWPMTSSGSLASGRAEGGWRMADGGVVVLMDQLLSTPHTSHGRSWTYTYLC